MRDMFLLLVIDLLDAVVYFLVWFGIYMHSTSGNWSDTRKPTSCQIVSNFQQWIWNSWVSLQIRAVVGETLFLSVSVVSAEGRRLVLRSLPEQKLEQERTVAEAGRGENVWVVIWPNLIIINLIKIILFCLIFQGLVYLWDILCFIPWLTLLATGLLKNR